MRRFLKLFKQINDQSGLGLVETLAAVAILGTAVTAFVVSLSAGSLAVAEQDTETVAQGLAQTQIEYTKSYAFIPGAGAYPAVPAPPGYSIAISVSPVAGVDANMQKITVNIFRDGSSVFLVSDYKVNR